MSEPAVKPISFNELDALEDRALHRQLPPACEAYVADMGLRLDAAAYNNKAYPDVMMVVSRRMERHKPIPY